MHLNVFRVVLIGIRRPKRVAKYDILNSHLGESVVSEVSAIPCLISRHCLHIRPHGAA